MRIGLDFDGVIARQERGTIEFIRDARLHMLRLTADRQVLRVVTTHERAQDTKRWLATMGLQLECSPRIEGLDVYVDDDITVLKPLVGKVPYLLLLSQPSNEQVIVADIAYRMHSWRELYQVISFIQESQKPVSSKQ